MSRCNPAASLSFRAVRRGLGLFGLVAWAALSAVQAGTITVTWTDNSSNETGFKIERSSDGVVYSEIATVGADVTQYIDAGLPNSTQYFYRVRATNASGDSNFSNVAGGVTFGPGGNSAPAISGISNQSISKNSNTGALAFTISDANTGTESLILSKSSSNTILVPNASVVLGGRVVELDQQPVA